MNVITGVCLVGAVAALAACETAPSETMIATSSNVSPSYKAGFDDGCHSGRQAAGSYFDQFAKDQARFNSDGDYAQGWSDAFRQCETREEELERNIRSAETVSAIQASSAKSYDSVLKDVDTSGLQALEN